MAVLPGSRDRKTEYRRSDAGRTVRGRGTGRDSYRDSYRESYKKARKKVAYRKKTYNGLGIFLATFGVLMLLVVVGVSGSRINKKIRVYAEREAELMQSIEEQKQRAQELDEYEKYTKTKKYVEEIAKDKLGLVYPREIVFIPDN